jgi:hypothetical protein
MMLLLQVIQHKTHVRTQIDSIQASSYVLHSSVDRIVVKRYLLGVVSHLVVCAKVMRYKLSSDDVC